MAADREKSSSASAAPTATARTHARWILQRAIRAARPIARSITEPIAAACRIARNVAMKFSNQSDYGRWGSATGLESWWDERTQKIAHFVPPASRVIEFGAGHRQLERLLQPDCTYTPSDLVDRGPNTIVCDLNCRPLPDLRARRFTVAVFGGVLEYIDKIPEVVAWLAASDISCVVASYEPVPETVAWVALLRAYIRRSYYGYRSNLPEAHFVGCFEQVGFVCVAREAWTTQTVYHFEKPEHIAGARNG